MTSHLLRSSLLLMLLTMALALEDRAEVEGDRPRSMQHNLNCETVMRSLNIEQLDSTPELHFHVDVQVRADIYIHGDRETLPHSRRESTTQFHKVVQLRCTEIFDSDLPSLLQRRRSMEANQTLHDV